MSQPKHTVHLSFIVLVLLGSLVDCMTLVHVGDGNLLHTVYQFKYYYRNTLTDVFEMFCQLSGHSN